MQIVIGAPAGFGVMSAGLILSKTILKSGFHVYDYQEYPSLIKGGNNSYFINFSDKIVRSAKREIDVLVCLDKATYDLHAINLSKNGVVIYNKNKFDLGELQNTIAIPASDIAKKLNAPEITVNNLLLGAVCKALKLKLEVFNEYIAKQFDEKHRDLVDENLQTVKAGYDFVSDVQINADSKQINADSDKNEIMLTGNEAISLGCIASNCQFYAAYPMTPSSAILTILAAYQEKTGMIVKHPEDEISALNMAIGASYAGVRASVATSGGGFSLMVEALGLAGITETPVVIFMGMRTGPSTGLPTYTSQGDLNFILNAGQGEFPRVVLLPGDVEETFQMTKQAFNVADLLQTPVFVLYDKMLGESHEETKLDNNKISIKRYLAQDKSKRFEAPFKRYDTETENGISLRSLPGQENGQYLANSYEHDEFGFATETADMTGKQMEKRMKKTKALFEKANELKFEFFKVYGLENPDLLIVSWGSNKGVILDAIAEVTNKKIGFLQIMSAEPFDNENILKILQSAKKVVDIEGNYLGQMANLIRAKTGFEIRDRLLKFDGRQFLLDEIVDYINKQ